MRWRWGRPCSCNHRIEVVALLLCCCCGLSAYGLALGSLGSKPTLAAAGKQQTKQSRRNVDVPCNQTTNAHTAKEEPGQQ
jgi:hypothetical protein